MTEHAGPHVARTLRTDAGERAGSRWSRGRERLVMDGLAMLRCGAPVRPGEPVVVFLHGLGCSGTIWPVPRLLDAGGPALLVDLPGHGRSRRCWPGDLGRAAEAVAGALDAVGAERTILVGHSLGGVVALLVDRMRGASNMGTLVIAAGARFAGLRRLTALLRSHPRRWAEEVAATLFGDGAPPVYRRATAASLARASAGTLAALDSLLRFDASELRGLGPAPRLLLSGSADPVTPPVEVRWLAAIIGAEHCEVEGGGHFLFLQDPRAVQSALNALVASAVTPRDRWGGRGGALGGGSSVPGVR